MDSRWQPLEYALLNEFQRDFPLTARPYAELGRKVGASETEVLTTLSRLQQRGAISRIGAVFAPRRIGASTLAALQAPAARLDEIAAYVSARNEVNHNYQRDHAWNLWFVVAAADEQALQATLRDIESGTGCKILSLPLLAEYHIDLGFDLRGAHKHKTPAPVAVVPRRPDAAERRLMTALPAGLALAADPYAELGRRAGMDEARVLGYLQAWLEEGLVKRFGVVVRHHELGFHANAMVVFDVADAAITSVGRQLALEPGVTLCYQRRRCPPEWRYNLYCMVHGRSREAVVPVIERLNRIAGSRGEALFSTRRFKQCGARYFADAGARQAMAHA